MDYKVLAQQTAQDILGYNQDTSGWKVVKSSVRKQICFKFLFLNEKQLIVKNIFYKQTIFALFYFVCFFFHFFSVLDS